MTKGSRWQMRRVLVCVATLLAFAATAQARYHAPGNTNVMWQVFQPGDTWSMRSSTSGHITRFHVRRLTHWACWRGDIIDLVAHKQSISDYWSPGQDVTGHQIELRRPDGSWRMIGTYAWSTDRGAEWTMQVHGYPGLPTPYVVAPARRVNSDTRTAYYTLYSPTLISRCLTGGPAAAPAWGRNVYWRSQFAFSHNTMHAHFEENMGCGSLPCQVENWTYAGGREGISSITDLRSGGAPMGLTLRRVWPTRS